MEALERQGWNPQRQCTGTNRAGERCQRNAVPGATVCILHGGAAPQVQAAAKVRLLAMVEPVLAAFEEILATWRGTRCESCGKPTGDPAPVIRVGQIVLDRSGFHPTLAIEQAQPLNEFADATEDELIDKLETMLADLRARRAVHRAHALPVLDAGFFEVPEDEAAPPIQESPEQIPVEIGTPADQTTDVEAAK